MRARSTIPLALALLAGACSDGTGPSGGWTAVTAGAFHTCAIDASHRAWCWGRNLYGALGDGTTEDRSVPTPVAGGLFFDSISAGYDYTCALTFTGAAWCWGENFGGQLGDGTGSNRVRPVRVAQDPLFRTISAGEAHTCGMSKAGQAYCWGVALALDANGGFPPDTRAPALISGATFAEVTSGYEIACATTAAGAPWCWGLRAPGLDLAESTGTSSYLPRAVATPGLSLSQLGAGTKHACGLAADGHAWCWGQNRAGQVGDGTTADTPVPHEVLGGHAFAKLSAHSPAHACALVADGSAWCWGAGGLGSLGAGVFGGSGGAPVAVAGGLHFRTIATGFSHTCGITTAGELYCWGYGGLGQLGTGALDNVNRPTPVDP